MRDRGGQRRREEILVVSIDRNRDRPDHEDGPEGDGRKREPPRRALGAVVQLADRAQRQERRAVEGEEHHYRDPGDDRVRREQIPEGAGVVAVRVDRHPADEVREADAPDERRAEAPDRVRPRPVAPARALALRAPLERDDADDEEEEDEQEREVEAREHRRVPGRERRERRAAGDDEPHLVAVPDRADRREHRAALRVVPRHERQQHPDAEVEPLEHEVAGSRGRDQAEPEGLEVHQYSTAGIGNSSPSPPSSGGSSRAYRRMSTKSTNRERDVQAANTPRLTAMRPC